MKNVPFFIKKTSVLLLGMSFFLGSCEIVDDGDQESFTSIDAYFSKKEVKPTSYKIDISTGGSFTTDKGSVLTIPENSFVTQDGKTVSGNVDIELKEVFSNADIINSGVFPVSGNNVLNSGGEFYVEARSNGELLKTSPGNFISLNIPAQAIDPNMQLFFGGPEQDTGDVNWMPIDTIPIDTMRGDTAQRFRSNSSFVFNSADNSYEIKLDSMGWGNIDAFMSTQYFDCTFNLVGLEGLDGTNTTAFAVFKDQNTVWPVGINSWGSISGNQILERHLADVDMNVVVISVIDKQLHYGLLDITPEQNKTYDIIMLPTESDKLDKIIADLP